MCCLRAANGLLKSVVGMIEVGTSNEFSPSSTSLHYGIDGTRYIVVRLEFLIRT